MTLRTSEKALMYNKNKRLFRQTEAYWQSSELSNTRILGLESGSFRAMHRPDAPNCETVWHLARVKAKRGFSARGDEPVGVDRYEYSTDNSGVSECSSHRVFRIRRKAAQRTLPD